MLLRQAMYHRLEKVFIVMNNVLFKNGKWSRKSQLYGRIIVSYLGVVSLGWSTQSNQLFSFCHRMDSSLSSVTIRCQKPFCFCLPSHISHVHYWLQRFLISVLYQTQFPCHEMIPNNFTRCDIACWLLISVNSSCSNAPTYAFGLSLLLFVFSNKFVTIKRLTTTFPHLKYPYHMLLEAIQAPHLYISSD